MKRQRISLLVLRSVLPTLLILSTSAGSLSADDWPQWRGPGRDGVWHETGIVDSFPGPQIKLRWSVPIGPGYSGPTVADGRVYVTDRLVEPTEVERIHCFDWRTGRTLWTHTYACRYGKVGYQAGPRASVTIDQGRAYALGTMGHLLCLDATDGSLLWQKTPGEDYDIRLPIWGVSAAPLVYGGLLIVQLGAEDGACLVALDKKTGKQQWRALDDNASYSAPIIVEQAGRPVLVCWTGDNVVGVAPASGKVYWKYPIKPWKMVINVPPPVVQGDRIFLSGFYDGAWMLRLKQDELAVEKIWRRRGVNERATDALHCMISTPLFEGDYIYGVDSYGQLRCLDAATGDRVWEDLTAVSQARWGTIHMVRNGRRTWMFNEQGELIIGTLSPKGFQEIDRAQLIEPTTKQLSRGVCWSHPAYANRHVFARNDRELVCASLAALPRNY